MTSSEFKRARDCCFYLLKFRLRSQKEIQDKLKQKKFSQEIVFKVIDYLKNLNYVNDEEFCRQWINSRLNKPLGLRRISFELKQKGIAQELINAQIKNVASAYPESEIVIKLAKERFKRLKGVPEYKAKARVYAFLMRRGFSPAIISDVISQL